MLPRNSLLLYAFISYFYIFTARRIGARAVVYAMAVLSICLSPSRIVSKRFNMLFRPTVSFNCFTIYYSSPAILVCDTKYCGTIATESSLMSKNSKYKWKKNLAV